MQGAKKAFATAAMMTVTAASALVLSASPASAEVWDCRSKVDKVENYGQAFCYGGFGPYRVRVRCNSAHWPYTREIDGPVVTKESTRIGPTSRVNGQPNGCHVVEAWLVAL